MATIYLQVEVERVEGKFVSNELVTDELIALVDGESLSIEDSEYEVISTDVVDNPNKKQTSAAPKGGNLGLKLDAIVAAYMEAFPLDLGGGKTKPTTDAALQELYRTVRTLMFDADAGKLIQDARVKVGKAAAKAKQDALKGPRK